MKLSDEDRRLFFTLFFSLLCQAGYEFGYDDLADRLYHAQMLTNAEFHELAGVLWENDYFIDEYLSIPELDMPDEYREIISGWNRHVTGTFVIERHLNSGSVFIDTDTQKVYLVKGITESWEEMMDGRPLPLLLDATLIPFKDVIISDGLVQNYSMTFGSGFKEQCREIYRSARRNKAMLKSL